MNAIGKLAGIGLRIGKRKAHRACTAVIAAAGSSSRMGGQNKLFVELGGIPVLARTLMTYESCALIDDIVIVARNEDLQHRDRHRW